MSDQWNYTDTVKEHFMNPKNVLQNDEDFKEDGKGRVGNIKCGDQMLVLIQVDDAAKIIKDCRWKTYGCASAIASTSMMSEMIKGMPIIKAYHLSPKEIVKALGALPENKIHCSVLGDKALHAAINDYYERSGQPEKIKHEKAILICECMDVTDHEIEEAVLEGAHTYLQLQEKTKIGTACGKCKQEAERQLEKFLKQYFS